MNLIKFKKWNDNKISTKYIERWKIHNLHIKSKKQYFNRKFNYLKCKLGKLKKDNKLRKNFIIQWCVLFNKTAQTLCQSKYKLQIKCMPIKLDN